MFSVILLMGCTRDVEVQDAFDFTLDIKLPTTGYVDEAAAFNIKVTPTQVVKGTTYKINYTVETGKSYFENGTPTVHLEQGKAYAMASLDDVYKFYPTEPGVLKITVNVENNNGVIKSKVISFTAEYSPFTFFLTPNLKTYNIGTSGAITSTIIRKSEDKFIFSYIVENGTGNFYTGKTLIPVGQNTIVEGGVNELSYNPKTLGTHKITATVTAPDGSIVTRSIEIIVDNIPFVINASSATTSINVNEEVIINIEVKELLTGTNATYEFSHNYNATSVSGVLKSADGTLFNAGVYTSIKPGAVQLKFKASTIGLLSISFSIRDNNGQIKQATIDMTAINTPVTFNASTTEQTFVNHAVPINFTLTPQYLTGTTYKMNYYISGGTGVLKNDATEIIAGNYFDVSTGSFKYDFTPTTIGNYTITFELKDSNNQIVTKSVTLVVLNNDFSFTPTASQQIFVNENNIFSYALVPTGDFSNITYNVSYTVEGAQLGHILQNGKEVQQGIPMKIVPTAFNLVYVPTTVGSHIIHYTISDSNGLVKKIDQTVAVTAVEFNFGAQQANKTIYKNVNNALILSLSQVKANPNIVYTMSYTLTGVGKILDNGVALKAFAPITVGNHNYTFVSNQSGQSSIAFTIIDSNGITHTSSVNYTVVNPDFNLSTSGDGSLYLGKSKGFNTFVSQVITDPTASYQVRYLIDSGSTGGGRVYSGDGLTEIPFGNYASISLGNNSLEFIGSQTGQVTLVVEIKDSNNLIHTSKIVFLVTDVGFMFSGSSQENTIYVKDETPINFDVTEGAQSGTNYEMKYSIVSGAASIKNGGAYENSNNWNAVNVGGFNRTFVATTAGTVTILFTVRNTTTLVEKQQTVSVTVLESIFSFVANKTDNNKTTTTPININFDLVQTGGETQAYKMAFSTTGTGTFTYNGIVYTAGQNIPFVAGASNGTYTGTTSGTHSVIFTATDSNNTSHNTNVNITYINNEFSLSTSGDGSLNVNTTKNFNVFLAQNNPDTAITYQVKYGIATGSIGDGSLTSGGNPVELGAFMPISLGTTALVFKGISAGVVNLDVTVKDNKGIIHSSSLAFDVKSTIFTFTGAPAQNTIYGNENTALTFDLTENAPSGSLYEAKFVVVEGDAIIKNGANTEISNQWYPVNTGGFSKTFYPKTVATTKVLFTVRNKTSLEEKTQLITVNVVPTDFSFSTYSSISSALLKKPISVNFNLLQTGGTGDIYNITFTSSGTGTFNYKGMDYVAGQNIPFDPTIAFGTYKGTTAGIHLLIFKATNQTGTYKSSNFSLSYLQNDFNLTTSGDGTLFYNTSKTVNIWISQTLPDPVTYKVKYTIASGVNGSVYINGSSAPLTMGVFYDIALGSSQLQFHGDNAGGTTLNVEILSSEGVTKSSQVAFTIKPTEFILIGAPAQNTIYQNENTALTFDLTENFASGSLYDIKYSIVSGDAIIKNGANTEISNQWYSTNVGGFNKTLFARTTGDVKVLFTLKNKTSLEEKTQLITIKVIPTDFSFTANSTSAGSLWNKAITVNFNLLQTGGTGDIYNINFTTSGTGNFNYNGVNYTSGQNIPFVPTITSGTYTGTTVENHNLVFNATNQYNTIKTSSLSLSYYKNNFTLSTTGDGTLYYNASKTFSLFFAQTYPDTAVTYKVKYTIASGVNGSVYINGSSAPLTMGVFYDIALGSSQLQFHGDNAGGTTLNVEILSSEGVTKSSQVMFNVIYTDFTITGNSSNNTPFVGDSTPINFEVLEAVSSGTNYEMMYVINSGSVGIKDGGTNIIQNVWRPIALGAFNWDLTALNSTNVSITFSVRNAKSLIVKTITVNTNPYQKPVLTSIRTGVEVSGTYNCGGGECSRDYRYLLSYIPTLNTGATLTEIVMTIRDSAWNKDRTFVITDFNHSYTGGYIMFIKNSAELKNDWQFGGQSYTLTVKDSNGVTNVFTGKFTDSTSDFF